jgi:hypothetical protein
MNGLQVETVRDRHTRWPERPGVGGATTAAPDWTQPSPHRAFIVGAAVRLSLRATVAGILPPWVLMACAVEHILIFEYLIRINNETLRLAIMHQRSLTLVNSREH